MRELTIDGRRISDDTSCFVIAEIGHNHQGSVERAQQLFVAARDCGVDAVKLQKRDNRTLYTRALYDSPYDNENSFGATYGAHREALELDRGAYVELQACARELGLVFFATAFDITSADLLAELDLPAFKIASGDLRNTPLLRHVASFGKPMLVSTGGATIEDVDRAVESVLPINEQVCLLQCTASYPAAVEELNLQVIATLRERYPGLVVGLSDHQDGIAMSLVAYMLGARVLEKHFTLSHTLKGTDHAFSLMPEGMRKLVRDLERVPSALGDGVKRPLPTEEKPLQKMGKQIVAARALQAGHVIAAADLAVKSPAERGPAALRAGCSRGTDAGASARAGAGGDVRGPRSAPRTPRRERPAVRPRRSCGGRHGWVRAARRRRWSRRSGSAGMRVALVDVAESAGARCGRPCRGARLGRRPRVRCGRDRPGRLGGRARRDRRVVGHTAPARQRRCDRLPARTRRPTRLALSRRTRRAPSSRVLDANVTGTVVPCQVFGAAMARAGRGSIVNVSSIYGMLSPDQSLYEFRRQAGEAFVKPVGYSVSKSAVLNLTRYLATYWAKSGVRVNTLTPHGIENGQPDAFVEAFRGTLAHRAPDGRRRGGRRSRLPRLGRVLLRHRCERRRRRRLVGLVTPDEIPNLIAGPGVRRRIRRLARQAATRATDRSSAGSPAPAAADVDRAVAAAREAQAAWGERTPVERGNVVREIALALRERREELSDAVAAETGKPLELALGRDGRRSRDGAVRGR